VGRWLIGAEPVVFIEVFPIWFVKELPALVGDSDSRIAVALVHNKPTVMGASMLLVSKYC
jgi:hypothetical protein